MRLVVTGRYGHTGFLKRTAHTAQSKLRSVIVKAKMAEEYAAERPGRRYGGKVAGCVGIVEMPCGGSYARLEIYRIAAVAEHSGIVVGLYHQVLGLADIMVGARVIVPVSVVITKTVPPPSMQKPALSVPSWLVSKAVMVSEPALKGNSLYIGAW